MRKTAQLKNGFSAVELMVVLIVAGILFAIGFPAMSTYMKTAKLNGAARMLEGDIHNAVGLANAQRRTYMIVFTAGSYVLEKVSPLTTIQSRTMPTGVTCAASDTAMFYAWGLADPITITVTNSHGTQFLRILANGSVRYN
ncbi:MAG: pilus assembly FimT family protein [Candidatus Eiseniibacteriota bacterium]